MERKDFLKNSLGFVGVSSIMLDACKKESDVNAITSISDDASTASCVVSPTETEGPYPYPGGEINNPLNRSDVREDRTGLPLIYTFKVVNTNNDCAVVPNARVDIWHCDRDGYYSGYRQPGYLGFKDLRGLTYLRGYQVTDANGICKFITIYPGWYPGRITHIHVEVFINGALKKITQVAFPDQANRRVYQTAPYQGHGQNTSVANNLADATFANSLASQLTTIDAYSAQGIRASYTIGLLL